MHVRKDNLVQLNFKERFVSHILCNVFPQELQIGVFCRKNAGTGLDIRNSAGKGNALFQVKLVQLKASQIVSDKMIKRNRLFKASSQTACLLTVWPMGNSSTSRTFAL